MVLLTLFFALKTDIVDFSADKILGGNFQILGENFPPEMPRINTAFWTLKSGGDRPPTPKSGGDRPPHSKKWGGDRSPRPPGNYAYGGVKPSTWAVAAPRGPRLGLPRVLEYYSSSKLLE
jgi:hypothetical protein